MKRLFILSLFLCFSISAQELRTIDIKDMSKVEVATACSLEGSEYGTRVVSDKPKLTIHSECKKFIQAESKHFQRTESSDGTIRVLAGLNIIYVEIDRIVKSEVMTYYHIIAGSKTSLNNIKSVALSADSKKLAIISEIKKNIRIDKDKEAQGLAYTLKKQLLIFDSRVNGNVAPLRRMIDIEINNSLSMSYHPNGHEIYLINTSNKNVVVFSTSADTRYANENRKPHVLRRIAPSEETFRTPSSIDFMNGDLLVLDSTTNKVISLNTKSNTIKWEMSNEDLGLSLASHLRYDESKKELIISDDQGNTVSFDQD